MSDVTVRVGQRVRLKPRTGGDILDAALAGRVAAVEAIDFTTDGDAYVSVTLDDDPGRDLGTLRYPGHRFFFRADEVESLDGSAPSPEPRTRILVAGIGNIFFGDDGFGVTVARRLAARGDTPGVIVRDFGIRGLDLAYALLDGYDVAILVDALPRGEAPGTLYIIEPEIGDDPPDLGVSVDAHGVDPVRVLRIARSIGALPPRILVVGCEPQTLDTNAPAQGDVVALSPAVDAAVSEAIRLIDSLVNDSGASHAIAARAH